MVRTIRWLAAGLMLANGAIVGAVFLLVLFIGMVLGDGASWAGLWVAACALTGACVAFLGIVLSGYPGTRSVGLAVCGLVVGFAAVTLPFDVETAGGVLLVHAGSLAAAALAIAMPQGRAPHGLGRAAFETALRVSVHLS